MFIHNSDILIEFLTKQTKPNRSDHIKKFLCTIHIKIQRQLTFEKDTPHRLPELKLAQGLNRYFVIKFEFIQQKSPLK